MSKTDKWTGTQSRLVCSRESRRWNLEIEGWFGGDEGNVSKLDSGDGITEL